MFSHKSEAQPVLFQNFRVKITHRPRHSLSRQPQAHGKSKIGRAAFMKGASIERNRCVHYGAGREADSLLSPVAPRISSKQPGRFRWVSVLLPYRKSQDVHGCGH
jgi:hypothetical protein